jgi:hypothetical protein
LLHQTRRQCACKLCCTPRKQSTMPALLSFHLQQNVQPQRQDQLCHIHKCHIRAKVQTYCHAASHR